MKNRKLNYIKEIREVSGISMHKLAKRSGLSSSTIYDVENGLRVPSQLTMISISRGLQKSALDVFVLDYDKLNNEENE